MVSKAFLADKSRLLRNFPVWVATAVFTPKLHRRVFGVEVRPMVKYLQKCGSADLVGAEVGVERGLNSQSILENLRVKTLFLVDPYTSYVDGNPCVDGVGTLRNPQKFKVAAQRRLQKFGSRVVFCYAGSLGGGLDGC